MEVGKTEQIMRIMQQHKIDLIALQETKINSSSEEIRTLPGTNEKYLLRFSSKTKAS